VASGVWLVVAGGALLLGMRRIMAIVYASSRRNAHRFAIRAEVSLDGIRGELVDVSVGGAAVRFPSSASLDAEEVELVLPKAAPVRMGVVRAVVSGDMLVVTLRVPPGNWAGYRTLSLWLFHTPDGALDGVPSGVPAAAATTRTRRSPALAALAARSEARCG